MMGKFPYKKIGKQTNSGKSKSLFLTSLLLSSLFLFIFSAFSCFESTQVNAFHADVFPHEIKQGDAFLIKVTNVPASFHPISTLNEKQLSFSSCGDACFIAVGAIEIKTIPGTYTMNILVGEKKETLTFTVDPTSFPTLHLTLPDEKVFLTPENLKRVNRESKKLQSLFQVVSEKLWHGSFILPLANDFSTAFGTKRIMNKKRVSVHRGLDIRGQMGEMVKASNRGRVVLAEELFFGGNTVIIDHGQGIYTLYMHLSEFKVQPGTIISKGDTIGLIGASGRATGPHLHFGVKVYNISVNPVSLVELGL